MLCVTGRNFKITKDNFERLATRTEYDSGFGAQEIASDLMIIGEDWWLERFEYDGSEHWEFKQLPLRYLPLREVNSLCCRYNNEHIGWCTLAELNEIKEDD